MQESDFSKTAANALSYIVDEIESQDSGGLLDVDFNSDIINIATQDGMFVINKHSAAQEIWLSSPISGPYHFANMQGEWKSKTGTDLFEILSKELHLNFNPSASR